MQNDIEGHMQGPSFDGKIVSEEEGNEDGSKMNTLPPLPMEVIAMSSSMANV